VTKVRHLVYDGAMHLNLLFMLWFSFLQRSYYRSVVCIPLLLFVLLLKGSGNRGNLEDGCSRYVSCSFTCFDSDVAE
jgi:hypothetical protein